MKKIVNFKGQSPFEMSHNYKMDETDDEKEYLEITAKSL